ncbi:hypothetical protein LguiB_007438 [Lonicera macranthoides]
MRESEGGDGALPAAVEEAKTRCKAVGDRIEKLRLNNGSCKSTLLRLVNSEISFLSRFPLSSSNTTLQPYLPLSVNIGHLEAVVHILQQPFITGVSRVCKPIPLSASFQNGQNTTTCSRSAHVDIVCTINGNPVWFIVSDRNPKYISWHGDEPCRNKGLRARIEQVLDAAQSSVTLKPSSIILFVSNGLADSVFKKLQEEFRAAKCDLEFSNFDCSFSEELDGEWIDVIARSYRHASILEIKVDCLESTIYSSMECGVQDSLLGAVRPDLSEENSDLNLGGSFYSLMSQIKSGSLDFKNADFSVIKDLSGEACLVNFDTTALIAIVSGISNGNTDKLLATPENILRTRFKSNFEFVIAQVMSEIECPIHMELGGLISGKRGIICESVYSEFKDLIAMCGGPNEKLRANHLLNHLTVVPDSPSARMMSLPTTRKLALKNKVVFGTGDYWHAPTLTANMAFVRAVSQTGMSLFTVEHRPRALTGD